MEPPCAGCYEVEVRNSFSSRAKARSKASGRFPFEKSGITNQRKFRFFSLALDMQPFGCILWRVMDAVFKALADESRRKLLDQLHRSNGQTLGELCAHLDIDRKSTRLKSSPLVIS